MYADYAVIILPLRSSFRKARFSNLRKHGQFRFLGNYLPTPPLSQHFALSDSLAGKWVGGFTETSPHAGTLLF